MHRKSLNNITKSRKRSIDVLGLLESLAFWSGSSHPLRSCKIHKDKPGLNLLDLIFFISFGLVNINMEDCMRPAWGFVHFLSCHLSKLHASINDIDSLCHSLDWNFNKPLHENFSIIFFSDLKILALLRIQQVLNLIQVNLIETQMHMPLEYSPSLLLSLQMVEDIPNGLWDYTMAVSLDITENSHGVCLTRACLPVNEIGPIESIEHIVDQGKACRLKYLRLCSVVIEYLVKLKFFWLILGDTQLNQLRVMRVSESAIPLALAPLAISWIEHCVIYLWFEGRSDPNEYLDCFNLLLGF